MDLHTWVDLWIKKLPPQTPIPTYRNPDLSEFVHANVRIVDLNLTLYVGTIEDKIKALRMLANLAKLVNDEEVLGIAKKHFKKLAEDTKLRYVIKSYEEC